MDCSKQPRYFLAPRSNETSYKNFLSTIENGVDVSIVQNFLEGETSKALLVKEKIFVWGCSDSKKNSWDKMKIGDVVLFYKGASGKYTEGRFMFAGRVVHKQYSKKLSDVLWPPKADGTSWSCVFFLDSLSPINMPISFLQSAAKYLKSFDRVQGFMPLNETGTKVFNKKFESYEALLGFFPENDIVGLQSSDLEEVGTGLAHRQAQLMLLKIGKILGYDTFTPDRNSEYEGEVLSNFCNIDVLSKRFIGEPIFKIVSRIDVIWLRNDMPKYCFEVENSTGVWKGLSRLCQLSPICNNLFIIGPLKYEKKFFELIKTDPFYKSRNNFYFKRYVELENFFKRVTEFNEIKNSFFTFK